MRDLVPMVQYLIWAMEGRGEMSMHAIYRAVNTNAPDLGARCPTIGRRRSGRRCKPIAPRDRSTRDEAISSRGIAGEFGHARLPLRHLMTCSQQLATGSVQQPDHREPASTSNC